MKPMTMTMKLHLDYAAAPHATPKWVWALLAISLSAVAVAVWQYQRLSAERAGLALQLQSRSVTTSAPRVAPLSGEAQAVQKEQVKQANAVLAELGRPWMIMFAQLEAAADKEIALLQVRPDAAKGRVQIVGEARHLADVLEYVRRLTTEGAMNDVVLEQHEVVEADAQKPVRFALSARWGAVK